MGAAARAKRQAIWDIRAGISGGGGGIKTLFQPLTLLRIPAATARTGVLASALAINCTPRCLLCLPLCGSAALRYLFGVVNRAWHRCGDIGIMFSAITSLRRDIINRRGTKSERRAGAAAAKVASRRHRAGVP